MATRSEVGHNQILGAWCTIPSSFSVELVSMIDLDFVVIDIHSPSWSAAYKQLNVEESEPLCE
jgi:2-keto-3-deoxy-L-rhamnonate aldolase RhmA